MNTARLVLVTVVFAFTLVAQQPGSSKASGPMTNFTLASPAFGSGGAIPDRYTCQGTDDSPALIWTGHPAPAASFALIVDDPDAPAGTWVHWVIWNIPSSSHLSPANVARTASLADGTIQGRNSFGKIGYNGPCPPPGKTHRYFFRLYALDTKLALSPGATRKELDAAMKGHILGTAEHMGTYRR